MLKNYLTTNQQKVFNSEYTKLNIWYLITYFSKMEKELEKNLDYLNQLNSSSPFLGEGSSPSPSSKMRGSSKKEKVVALPFLRQGRGEAITERANNALRLLRIAKLNLLYMYETEVSSIS